MSLETVLAIALAGAVVLNLLLALVLVAVRRRTEQPPARDIIAASRGRSDATTSRTAPTAAMNESDQWAGTGRRQALEPRAATFSAADRTLHVPVVLPRDESAPVVVPRRGRVGAPSELVDALTGLDGPLAWEQHLQDEASRIARYARPAAIIVAELVGVGRGHAIADEQQAEHSDRATVEERERWLVISVGEVFRREARRCDRVARVGNARYAVLLPETTEEQAVNYVDRVRAAIARRLDEPASGVRLCIGVAGPGPSGRLDIAVRLAEARMYADARSAGVSRPQE